MNDKHKIDDNLSLEDLRETLTSCSQNDTTPTASTTQTQENSQEATNEGNEAASTAMEKLPERTTSEASTQRTRMLEIYRQGDFIKDLSPTEYLIDNWIQTEALHVMFGESGSFKTFCVTDICEHIACTDFDTWCGKKVEHGEVIYLAGEGLNGIKKRFAGWCLKHGKNPADIPLYISPTSFFLDDTTPEHDVDTVIADIRAICSNPKLVVFDTLNRYMGGEENSATGMGAFVRACSKLINELHCAVLIVHHSGLAQESKGRGRGSGALYAALDIEIQCVKSGMTCNLIPTKNKDNDKDKPLSFNMEEIEIPNVRDKKGNPIRTTTLVPIFNEEATKTLATAEPETKKKSDTPKPSKAFTRGIDTFKEAAIRYGRLSTNETGESFIDVELKEWRKVAYETIEGNSKGNSEDSKRNKFNAARAALIEDAKTRILTRYENEEGTYYRLSRNNEVVDPTLRVEIFGAVMRRIEEENKSATANDAGAEAERTADMFKD